MQPLFLYYHNNNRPKLHLPSIEHVVAQRRVAMYCHFFAFMTTVLLYSTTSATPYFKPWLETRQNPTLNPVSMMIYPPNNNADTCYQTMNLWNGAGLAVKRRKKRSLNSRFHVPRPGTALQKRQRQLLNGTCTNVAQFDFVDWESGYDVNTPTITLEGGHIYTFSIATNVDVKKLQAWTLKGKDWKTLNETQPMTRNATMVTKVEQTMPIHWNIEFRFGAPGGKIAVFSDQGYGPVVPVTVQQKRGLIYRPR